MPPSIANRGAFQVASSELLGGGPGKSNLLLTEEGKSQMPDYKAAFILERD